MIALRAFICLAFALFFLVATVPPIFVRPPRIESGVTPVFTMSALQPNTVRVASNSPAYRAGLRTGDVLGCLSVRDYQLLIRETELSHHGYVPGTQISTCVPRAGTTVHITFTANAGAPIDNLYGSYVFGALRVVVVLVFLVTATLLVMARPSLMTWIFFAFSLGSLPSLPASQVWTILPAWQFAFLGAVPVVFVAVSSALLLLFALIVPDDRIPHGWRRYAFAAASIYFAIDFGVALLRAFNTTLSGWPVIQNAGDVIAASATVLVVLVRLLTMERDERARFGWAAFAILFGIIDNSMRNVFSISNSAIVQTISIVAAELTVVMPLALMYGILRRHVIDVRFVISRTVVYAVLTTLVVLVIGVVDWATSQYLSQVRLAMAIDAAVTIGLAFALHRAYGLVERAVEFMLFRRRHEAEQYLHRLARSLMRADREETIDHAIVQAPFEKLDLTMAALFRANGSTFYACAAAGSKELLELTLDRDDELIRFLATERTRLEIRDLRRHVAEQFHVHGAAPALAIPLFEGDELAAFALFGLHRDGTQLDPDEVQTLERVCEVAAQAYVRIELLQLRTGIRAADTAALVSS